jgi:hypothetical protein
MRLIPEYDPVSRINLSFVHKFFNTRFHSGKAICSIAKAACNYVDVEIFVCDADLPHLLRAMEGVDLDPETVLITDDSPERGFMNEFMPIFGQSDSGEGIALFFDVPHLDQRDEVRSFTERFLERLGLERLDMPGPFASAAISASDDLVLVSNRFPSNDAREQTIAFLASQFPHQDFHVVPPLFGDVTKDLDMFIWPVGQGEWVVSEYALKSEQAGSLEPTLKILEEYEQRIHRVPGLEPIIRDDINTMPNYANGVLLNQAALVPFYGCPEDSIIVGIMENLGYEVFPIDCSDVILSNAGVHCLSKTLPRCTVPTGL